MHWYGIHLSVRPSFRSFFSNLNTARGVCFLSLIGYMAHILRDSLGGSMQRGQFAFPSEYYKLVPPQAGGCNVLTAVCLSVP